MSDNTNENRWNKWLEKIGRKHADELVKELRNCIEDAINNARFDKFKFDYDKKMHAFECKGCGQKEFITAIDLIISFDSFGKICKKCFLMNIDE